MGLFSRIKDDISAKIKPSKAPKADKKKEALEADKKVGKKGRTNNEKLANNAKDKEKDLVKEAKEKEKELANKAKEKEKEAKEKEKQLEKVAKEKENALAKEIKEKQKQLAKDAKEHEKALAKEAKATNEPKKVKRNFFGRKKEEEKVIEVTTPQDPSALALPIVETYPIHEPYSHVAIVKDPVTDQLQYSVIEPSLSADGVKLLTKLTELLKYTLNIDVKELSSLDDAEVHLRMHLAKIMKNFKILVSKESMDTILYYLTRNMLRYHRIDGMMGDPAIEDISCDGPGIPIYVWHREFESIPSNVIFEDKDELDRFVLRLAYLAGTHVSVASPIIDAGLPEGSRLQMTYGSEVTKKGSTFTIRKFKEDPLSIIDLISYGTVSSEMAAHFWFAIENKLSTLLSGGTASGKTTSINCFSMFIRPEAKIVTIEDTPELNLPHENWIQSVARAGVAGVGEVTLFDLLKAAMRQRPDFIIVGEVRGNEAYTLFQAMSTGHAGLSSIHADSVAAVFRRLTSDPMNIPRTLIPSINYVIQQNRITINGKPRRRIMSITEIIDVDTQTGEFLTNEVYKYDVASDSFFYGGRSYMLEKIGKERNYSESFMNQEIQTRKKVLDWLSKKNIRRYKDVAQVIREYYISPKDLMSKVELDSF
ncbi:MAG: ATPase, T2SS/T4P/T4SS family [Thaumarchaeota archaeon]|nr:ATPase, T2SS/T4P/T4SS family [Nitrososphaerota archaeon]